MYDVLAGYRILELSAWTFVPSCGAICADWGADVIKIEPPDRGDPQRSKFTDEGMDQPADVMLDLPNRGKRSIGIDLRQPEGRHLFHKLVETADVVLTGYLPGARKRLGIDVDSLRKINPRIIAAYGSGHGPRGPEAEDGGYDLCSGWAKGGMVDQMIPAGGTLPACPPAIVDLQSGFNLAAGITGALLRRERTGKPSVVDVSLLSTAIWMSAPNIMAASYGGEVFRNKDRMNPPINPVVNNYETADGRWLSLVLLQSERYWEEFCNRIDRSDLIHDERFATTQSRDANKRLCVETLDEIFAAKPLSHWKEALKGMKGPWSPVQTPAEVLVDPQVLANGYITTIQGTERAIVPGPVQFDEPIDFISQTPAYGENTVELLAELGVDAASRDTLIARGTVHAARSR